MAWVELDLPYLWPAKGRGGKRYWYYRRDGHRIPITSPEGGRLFENDNGFVEAWERLHASFEADLREAKVGPKVVIGTIGHAVPLYLSDPETKELKPRTQEGYRHYLNELLTPHRENEKSHGHRALASLTPEAVRVLRDERADQHPTANGRLQAISAFLTWVEGRPLKFRLPQHWRNPALSVKHFKTGDGHRPWEESEIKRFYKRWPLGTPERVVLEVFIYSGQRHIDVAKMRKEHYYRGEISVVQEKTKARVWIPAAKRLKNALDPWLASHPHGPFFPDAQGKPMSQAAMGKMMRAAISDTGLPADCTLHGLRYTFATRMREIGLDYEAIEDIVGHKTAAMAIKYTKQKRRARLGIKRLDRALDELDLEDESELERVE